jgi:hypothetical protein
MTHAQTACPEAPLAFRRAKANDRGPSLADRLRALYARIANGFEDHGEYFAEMEGALSPHVRERRQARRHRDRLALFAALGR